MIEIGIPQIANVFSYLVFKTDGETLNKSIIL